MLKNRRVILILATTAVLIFILSVYTYLSYLALYLRILPMLIKYQAS